MTNVTLGNVKSCKATKTGIFRYAWY